MKHIDERLTREHSKLPTEQNHRVGLSCVFKAFLYEGGGSFLKVFYVLFSKKCVMF
jgi:hypothetical protein